MKTKPALLREVQRLRLRVVELLPNEEERIFWSKVDVKDDQSCWLWLGCRLRNGYGQFNLGSNKELAHRTAHRLCKGETPDDLMVRHTCDTRDCVNPNHLVLGTHEDNMRDMVDRGRARNQWSKGYEKA